MGALYIRETNTFIKGPPKGKGLWAFMKWVFTKPEPAEFPPMPEMTPAERIAAFEHLKKWTRYEAGDSSMARQKTDCALHQCARSLYRYRVLRAGRSAAFAPFSEAGAGRADGWNNRQGRPSRRFRSAKARHLKATHFDACSFHNRGTPRRKP